MNSEETEELGQLQRDILQVLDSAGRKLHRLLYRLTLREDVAEELLQELVVRLSASDGFSVATDKVAFAFRAAIHLAIDWRRRSKRQRGKTIQREPEALQLGVMEQVLKAEELEQVLEALEQVSPAAREVFVMHFLDERSYEQIGEALGLTAHSTRAMCHKAVRQVRQIVGQREVRRG